MASVASPARPVKPERPAFRPVKTVDEISWADFDNRPEVTIHKGRSHKTYHLIGLSTDLAGVAFRLHKTDGSGESYDLLLGGGDTNCSCPGFCWTGGCCHLTAIQMLLEAGVIEPAPASASGDFGGDAA